MALLTLCSILQDSESEWHREAGMMNLVYQNGICNIAASHPTDPNLGLYLDREPKIGAPLSISFHWAEKSAVVNVYCDWFEPIQEFAAVNRRAWVLQERLLSPRTIHFASFPYWECRELISCEGCPSGLGRLYPGGADHFVPPQPSKLNTKLLQDPTYVGWPDVIDIYSKCALTEPRDKLCALSGIAKTFARCTKAEYCAGLWSNRLLEDLLWQSAKGPDGHDIPGRRSEVYIGQSRTPSPCTYRSLIIFGSTFVVLGLY